MKPGVTGNPAGLGIIFVLSVLICAYDLYNAYVSQWHNVLAIILAVVMALIAVGALRKLLRRDYSNSWW